MARGDDITDCRPAACPVPACEDDPTTNNNKDSQSELWFVVTWEGPEARSWLKGAEQRVVHKVEKNVYDHRMKMKQI